MASGAHQPLCVVTGASSGIGRALARELAVRGCDVVAVARREPLLDHLRSEQPGRIRVLAADLAEPSSVRLIAAALPAARSVYAFVHCAGIAGPVAGLLDLTDEQWRRHFAINVDAPLRLTRDLVPYLRGGRVLFIGSDSATRPRRGWGAYCASKAAAAMLRECLRAELEPMGIAVGIAKPGAVDTDLLRAARDAGETVFPDAQEIRGLYEQGSVASSAEAAAFLAYLLLDVGIEEFGAREWDRRQHARVPDSV